MLAIGAALGTAGCDSSTTPTAAPERSAPRPTTATASALATPAGTTTSVLPTPGTIGAPTTSSASTVASGAPAVSTTTPTATAQPTSLPVWSPPANAVPLPTPDGAAAVGVAASGLPDTVVYYPAVAGTGRGHYRYLVPELAVAAGLDPAQTDRVLSTAQIDATPTPVAAPRPVMLLTPGWRSVVALSTALAEDLASHGYIVLATQTDVVAEWRNPSTTPEERRARLDIIQRQLDLLRGPALAALVGPIDVHRVAVGGHSYAGTIAFDAMPGSDRITAVVDLDGSARGEAVRAPVARPTLTLVTVDQGKTSDPTLGQFAARSPEMVTVGELDALHMDITDAATFPTLMGTSVFSTLIGTVGPSGTTDASTIVVRYLDAVLGTPPRQPTARELVHGLHSATADPFGAQQPG